MLEKDKNGNTPNQQAHYAAVRMISEKRRQLNKRFHRVSEQLQTIFVSVEEKEGKLEPHYIEEAAELSGEVISALQDRLVLFHT